MTHQNKALFFCFKFINMKFAFWLDFPQPTGTPLAPSWSCRPCRALLESSLGSSLLPTFQPSRGSIAPLLLASCSSFRVSGGGGHEWSGSNNRPGYRVKFKNVLLPLSCSKALFVLLAMAIYTGVTVNFLGKRFGDWRFSWSYILGWVALLMTFFAGLLKEKVFNMLLQCYLC